MAVDVLVPPLGQTVDTMTLVQWYKADGDSVSKGEPLFVIETDKANLDIEAPASGVLRSITAQAGDEVKALTRLALVYDIPMACNPSTAELVVAGYLASRN